MEPTLITDQQARQALVSEPTVEPSEQWLLRIGLALNKSGENLPGNAPVAVVANCLIQNPDATWESVLNPRTTTRPSPFLSLLDGASKAISFQQRLGVQAEHRDAIRAFARSSKNPAVAARLFDVMFEAFNDRSDACSALQQYLILAPRLSAEDNWTDAHFVAGRALQLAILRDQSRLHECHRVLRITAKRVLKSRFSFAFTKFAEAFAAIALTGKIRATFRRQGPRWWALQLAGLAKALDSCRERFHAQNAWSVLEFLQRRRGCVDESVDATRQLIDSIFNEADEREVGVRPFLLDRALSVARSAGLASLIDDAQLRLGRAVQDSAQVAPVHQHDFEIPTTLFTHIDELLSRSPTGVHGVRALAANFAVPSAQSVMRASAEHQLRTYLFAGLFPSYHMRGVKIANRAFTPEQKLAEAIARNAEACLAITEAVLRHALQSLFASDKFTPTTLAEVAVGIAGIDRRQIDLLAISAERFYAQDWVASGFIVLPLYESVLRSFVRAHGYHATKIDPQGLQVDETLNSLLQTAQVRTLVGEDHAWWVEFLLCRPNLGPNLRNEVAHGNVSSAELTPGKVFLVWLFLTRLCFVVSQGSADSDSAPIMGAADAQKDAVIPESEDKDGESHQSLTGQPGGSNEH